MKIPDIRWNGVKILLIGLLLSLFNPAPAPAASSMSGTMPASGASAQIQKTQAQPRQGEGPFPQGSFAIEGLLGGDTELGGSYQTTDGISHPYAFGSSPLWGFRIGKEVFDPLFLYLTFQQSFFSQNTHSVVGAGMNLFGSVFDPEVSRWPVIPYLNFLFGASYNTFNGTNAQAGYAVETGLGGLVPLNKDWSVFGEIDFAYESAPTGIDTSLGGTISQVDPAISLPVMLGVRYSF